jgi:hypothetical protein
MLEATAALMIAGAFTAGYGVCWLRQVGPWRARADYAEYCASLAFNEIEHLRDRLRVLSNRLHPFERQRGPRGRFIPAEPVSPPSDRIAA